jgi:glycine cleavage system transcriptional repressor
MPIVISTLGDDRPGIVEELSRTILEQGCNIEDSRMSEMGGVFAVILLVSGEETALVKLKDSLNVLADTAGLTITSKDASDKQDSDQRIPYEASIVSLDHPGIVNNLSHFFATRGINIQSLNTTSYSAAHTATPMFAVKMAIEIPAGQSLSELRKAFNELCDEYNLDGAIEAVRPE